MDELQHIPRQTASGQERALEALARVLPEVVSEDGRPGHARYAVDWDALREALDGDIAPEQCERYAFTWPGKAEARREAARPTTRTLRPDATDSRDWDNTQNVYIEGDNLEALKLLHKSYMGRVKMIYIDPPYNTGKDFIYHDNYHKSQKEAELAAGDIDELGNRYRVNSSAEARFHSDWCTMIYARLLACRALLTEDGVIFISIDDNEVANLKKICDEVFGEGNFVARLVWESKSGGSADEKYVIKSTEYILVYCKNKPLANFGKCAIADDNKYKLSDKHIATRGKFTIKKLDFRMTSQHYTESLNFPVTDPDGNELWPGGLNHRQDGGWNWRWSREKIKWGFDNDFLYFNKTSRGWVLNSKQYQLVNNAGEEAQRAIAYRNLFTCSMYNTTQGSIAISEIFGTKIFEYAKPYQLISALMNIANLNNKDVILDFFSGSATTAHAVMQLNAEDGGHRKYICVQLPEETAADSEARKAGYKNICEVGKERIRRAGDKIKAESPLTTGGLDTGFRVFRVADSNFRGVELPPVDYEQAQLALFETNIKEDRTELDLLFGALLASGVPEALTQRVERVDVAGRTVYNVGHGALVAYLDPKHGVPEAVVEAIIAQEPLRVLFRDDCFRDDNEKINAYERIKQAIGWSDDEAHQNIVML